MKINCISIFEIIKKGMLLFLFSITYLLAQGNTKGTQKLTSVQDEFNTVRAVIVGVSNYMNIDPLDYAHKDAIAFYDYLRSRAGGLVDSLNIKLLTNENATALKIFEALDWITGESEEGDLAIFYFSGHGDLETKTIRQNGFLLAYDAPESAYMSGGTIGINYLQDYLETIVQNGKSSVILLSDACKSGKLAGGIEGVKQTTAALQENWANIVKILSSQPGELSYESDRWGNGAGVFTYYLLRGLMGLADLNNDNQVNLKELDIYLSASIPVETNFEQNPIVNGNPKTLLAGIDSLILASLLNEETTKPKPIGELLAMKGREKSSLDTATTTLLKQFQLCLNSGLLIYPSENGKSAWGIYSQLKDREDLKAVIASMRTSLIASLQEKSQTIINSFLKGKVEDADSIDLYSAYDELSEVFSLIDTNYILYYPIKAKHIFMESLFYSNNEYDNRIELLLNCLRLQPDAAYAYCELGRACHDAKRYDDAIANYGKAIELSPRWKYPYYNVGIVYADLKQNEKAIENYNKAIEIDPDYKDAFNNLGLINYNTGDHAKAIEYYNKTVDIDPNYKLGYYNLGIAYYDLKQMDKARENFYKATEIDPSYSDAYNYLGLTYYNNGDYDKAIEYYNKALAIDSNYLLGYYNSGIAYYDLKHMDKARENFYKATEIDPSYTEAYNYLGIIYYNEGDYSNAIEYYNRAVEIDSNYKLGYYNLGIAYYESEQLDQAIENFRKAAEIDLSYTDAYNYLGIIYYAKGDQSKAIEYYNKVVEIDPNYKLAYYNLGLVFTDLGETEKALLNYNQTIKLDSNYVNAYDRAGIIYYQLKDYESGIKIYNKYIQFYPADSYGYQMRGLNYFYNGDFENALIDLNKVIELTPNDPGGYYNLACFYSVTENELKSLECLEKAFINGYSDFDHLDVDPDLDKIRSQPEYVKLVQKYRK